MKSRFLSGTEMSVRYVAKEIRRSKTAIKYVIQCKTIASVQKRSGAKSKLGQRDRKRIICFSPLKKKKSAAEIFCHFEGKVSRITITRALNKCSFTKYVKMNKKSLTDKHKNDTKQNRAKMD